MTKIDSQGRICIPCELLISTGLFPIANGDEFRLAYKNDHLVVFRATDFPEMEYHDVITFDQKGRFILKSHIRKALGLVSGSMVIISALNNHIIIRW